MKYTQLLLFFFLPFLCVSQDFLNDQEMYPVFDSCSQTDFAQRESCFLETLKAHVFRRFELPESVKVTGFRGEAVILFEVTREGEFVTIYVDAPLTDIKEEISRVFKELPRVSPAQYNGRPISMQFRMPIRVPLDSSFWNTETVDKLKDLPEPEKAPAAYDLIQNLPPQQSRLTSQLNIPFSHEFYSRFADEVNQVGTNFHSASKPFLYREVAQYYDLKQETEKLLKPAQTWFGRKLWNEHLFRFRGEDYWFAVDFGVDLQVGRDLGSDLDVTYNNTRAAILQGGLGKKFNFYSVVYESQGRFADYFNQYAESLKPGTEGAAVIHGRGVAKEFMGNAYDYPVAVGYLSFTPSRFFNLQFGHGKNFIGDGYRSLLVGDHASPYPFFKLNTTFWKIKYTNTWMSLRDVRPEVTGEGSFRTKFMANHYLSYNVTKRLNLGFFESVMWEDDNNRGFDLNYLNPVIFYRAIEYATGHQACNAIMGLTAKYKWSDQFLTYGQWLIDEFSSSDVFGGAGSWKNKHGLQLGMKYFDAFSIPELYVQLEYNQVRPYTYSHNTVTLNYGHNNQSMAHFWGANFREFLGIARYHRGRYYGMVKMIYGQRGFDFNSGDSPDNYGGDIYRTEVDRPFDMGVEIGQGNQGDMLYAETEVGYIVNPVTNLKLFGSFIFRDLNMAVESKEHMDSTTLWFNIGLRTDIFNWYFDY